MLDRNRIMYVLIALGVVLMIVVYGIERCENDRYQIHGPWKPEKKNIITWKKADTIIMGDTVFTITCPECFEVLEDLSLTDSIVVLKYKGEESIELIAYVTKNLMNWSVQGAADSISMVREIQEGDTVTMKDMHDGYFYLKGLGRSRKYNFYEQHILDEGCIYTLILIYPTYKKDEEMQNILRLVHDWNPK